mmetsp:Transcript_4685/g.7177  ORF Transcript_4685/g.7177 Transcript_4685/m.7177 type:complete len:959 (+) Transcript_4685:1576-4452(+)
MASSVPSGVTSGREYVQVKKLPPKNIPSARGSLVSHDSKTFTSTLKPSERKANENERKVSSALTIRRQIKTPGPSILKRSGGNKSKFKKVHFSSNIEEAKHFEPGAAIVHCITTNATRDKISNSTRRVNPASIAGRDKEKHKTESIDKLTHTILCKNHRDLIQLLKTGEYANIASSDSKTKSPLDYVKERLSYLQRDRTNNSDAKSYQDFMLKKKVLKIFINAKHIIDLARHLKHWVSVEMVPHQIKDFQLTDKGIFHPSTNFLFCLVHIDGAKEADIPLTPFETSIEFENMKHCPKYMIPYNKQLDFTLQDKKADMRVVNIKVIKGDSPSQHSNVKLGTWTETIKNIGCNAETFGEKIIEGRLKKTEFLAGGSICVKVRMKKLGVDFKRNKRLDIAKQLSGVIDWITMFQKETSENSKRDHLLDVNISFQSSGGLSLLHAAVYAADLKLVKRLLSLGADPNAGSEVGTAKELSYSLADKTKDECDKDLHNTYVAIRRDLYSCSMDGGGNCIEHPNDAELDKSLHNKIPSRENVVSDVNFFTDNKSERQHYYGKEATKSGFATDNQHDVNEVEDKVQSHLESSLHGQSTNLQFIRQNTTEQPLEYAMQSYSSQVQDAPIVNTIQKTFSKDKYTSDSAVMQTFPNTALQKTELPQLPSLDWIEERKVRCPLFSKADGCPLGIRCSKAHCITPFGSYMYDVERFNNAFTLKRESWNNLHVHFKEALDAHLRTWYTAAYFDRERNIIVYAERGDSSSQSQQGIYWYCSKDDALEALKKAWTIATPMNSRCIQTSETGKKRTLQYPHAMQPGSKKSRTGQIDNSEYMKLPQLANTNSITQQPSSKSTNTSNPNLIHKVMKANLQEVYLKIFPGEFLPKKCWHISGFKGLFTAKFQSPAKEDKGAVYSSSEIGGGLYKNGCWWYNSVKSAKVSSFVQFLMKAAEKCLVNHDMTQTITGLALFK